MSAEDWRNKGNARKWMDDAKLALFASPRAEVTEDHPALELLAMAYEVSAPRHEVSL